MSNSAALAQIDSLRRDTAFMKSYLSDNKSDPAHREAVAKMQALFAQAYPEPAQSDAVRPQAESTITPARATVATTPGGDAHARLDALRRNPAYLDVRHPEHTAVKAEVTAAYQAAFPDPAASGAAASPTGS